MATCKTTELTFAFGAASKKKSDCINGPIFNLFLHISRMATSANPVSTRCQICTLTVIALIHCVPCQFLPESMSIHDNIFSLQLILEDGQTELTSGVTGVTRDRLAF